MGLAARPGGQPHQVRRWQKCDGLVVRCRHHPLVSPRLFTPPTPARHGVNLTKVPLPVELCEPRSFLQRLADSWSYLDLLHAAAAAT
jgi:hypothetical protein